MVLRDRNDQARGVRARQVTLNPVGWPAELPSITLQCGHPYLCMGQREKAFNWLRTQKLLPSR